MPLTDEFVLVQMQEEWDRRSKYFADTVPVVCNGRSYESIPDGRDVHAAEDIYDQIERCAAADHLGLAHEYGALHALSAVAGKLNVPLRCYFPEAETET